MKSLTSIIIIAVIGAVAMQFVPVDSSIAFVLGALIAGFTVNNVKRTNSTSFSSVDAKKSSKTIYVGNLPYRANEADVRKLFSEYGEVFAVRLMKDKRTGKRRGFGFVVMASADTDNAIEKLNNHDFDQRTLKVRIANDPKTTEEHEA
ncbi:RNA recognition motif domain-containing protein [Aliivibrio kagoshimensis]|uniref:RNA recognition motif domain-containing protein n=1 Tax=Aliivibrio kagoshimensis TaxID=2910230 RepID=UPI003D0E5C74